MWERSAQRLVAAYKWLLDRGPAVVGEPHIDIPVEVLVDAGKVNTLDGWRDVKLGLFLKREAGTPATPEEWDRRDLPAPSARPAR